MDDRALILGCRGSAPVSGRAFSVRGGATFCVLVRLSGQYIIVDAGTGILGLPRDALEQPSLPLLLTHPHADHIIGLAMCPYLFREGARMDIYGRPREGLSVSEQLYRVFSPPIWPVSPEEISARVTYNTIDSDLVFGPVNVEVAEGVHTGGVSLFRISGGGKSVVVATDCTISDENEGSLADFARGCDLLLCDGQYSAEEWDSRSGYGHSTWEAAARLGKLAGAAKVRIVHHDPSRTDDMIASIEKELSARYPQCSFACCGEEVDI